MVRLYIPDRGDIIWLDFNPQAGREQSGHRPAFVVSPQAYNKISHLAIACPITSKSKGWRFEVKLVGLQTNGVILTDQIKSLDLRMRNSTFIERASDEIIRDVLAKIEVLVT
ncbi:endoribonuclease MazF [Tumidithrix helvetica PCC 7403]|uniref:endoribonuclease MazF n=1 Tax=Tumidithrix helvetica TaxID=3457545 RepID=UPI003CA73513